MDPELRQSYLDLFAKCETLKQRVSDVANFINKLMNGQSRYVEVQTATNVPWYVVGLLHGMEASFSFTTHLHNGDSLKARTVNVPAGRPPTGTPPFNWDFSAIDALTYDKLVGWSDWSIAGICYKLEAFNGWGYRQHHINSPYLWSFSNNYTSGKYVADGVWDANAVSRQCGAITALKTMIEQHVVALAAESVA